VVTRRGVAQSIIQKQAIIRSARCTVGTARAVQERARVNERTNGFTSRILPARVGVAAAPDSFFHALERTRGLNRAANPASGS
jgi:hypothetical protein